MNDLLSSISKFYHRWHALEATLGDGVQVLDFDFCPREDLSNLGAPFANRLETLRQLEELRSSLAVVKPESLCNADFMIQKLAGAAMFLRALMGEHIPFEPYLRATMGIEPEVISKFEIEAMRAELENRFSSLNIPFSADGKEAFEQYLVLKDISQFEHSLRTEATYWVRVLQQRIGLTAQPTYEIEAVCEDAYWTNWIDGSLDSGIRLRINTHPRITFLKGGATGFAVHEIGGHALQMLELDAARRAGEVDGAALNLTVHSCEQFQFEGLAQSVMYLVAKEGEIPEALEIDQKLRGYHAVLTNNAQIELEFGRPVDEVIERLLSEDPFLPPLKAFSDLRDRARHPLYRAYMFVYAPSKRKFLTARSLSKTKLIEFLHSMYTRLWTPAQIDSQLRTLLTPANER